MKKIKATFAAVFLFTNSILCSAAEFNVQRTEPDVTKKPEAASDHDGSNLGGAEHILPIQARDVAAFNHPLADELTKRSPTEVPYHPPSTPYTDSTGQQYNVFDDTENVGTPLFRRKRGVVSIGSSAQPTPSSQGYGGSSDTTGPASSTPPNQQPSSNTGYPNPSSVAGPESSAPSYPQPSSSVAIPASSAPPYSSATWPESSEIEFSTFQGRPTSNSHTSSLEPLPSSVDPVSVFTHSYSSRSDIGYPPSSGYPTSSGVGDSSSPTPYASSTWPALSEYVPSSARPDPSSPDPGYPASSAYPASPAYPASSAYPTPRHISSNSSYQPAASVEGPVSSAPPYTHPSSGTFEVTPGPSSYPAAPWDDWPWHSAETPGTSAMSSCDEHSTSASSPLSWRDTAYSSVASLASSSKPWYPMSSSSPSVYQPTGYTPHSSQPTKYSYQPTGYTSSVQGSSEYHTYWHSSASPYTSTAYGSSEYHTYWHSSASPTQESTGWQGYGQPSPSHKAGGWGPDEHDGWDKPSPQDNPAGWGPHTSSQYSPKATGWSSQTTQKATGWNSTSEYSPKATGWHSTPCSTSIWRQTGWKPAPYPVSSQAAPHWSYHPAPLYPTAGHKSSGWLSYVTTVSYAHPSHSALPAPEWTHSPPPSYPSVSWPPVSYVTATCTPTTYVTVTPACAASQNYCAPPTITSSIWHDTTSYPVTPTVTYCSPTYVTTTYTSVTTITNYECSECSSKPQTWNTPTTVCETYTVPSSYSWAYPTPSTSTYVESSTTWTHLPADYSTMTVYGHSVETVSPTGWASETSYSTHWTSLSTTVCPVTPAPTPPSYTTAEYAAGPWRNETTWVSQVETTSWVHSSPVIYTTPVRHTTPATYVQDSWVSPVVQSPAITPNAPSWKTSSPPAAVPTEALPAPAPQPPAPVPAPAPHSSLVAAISASPAAPAPPAAPPVAPPPAAATPSIPVAPATAAGTSLKQVPSWAWYTVSMLISFVVTLI